MAVREYGYDITDAKFFRDKELIVEIPISDIPEETLHQICGDILIVRCRKCKNRYTEYCPMYVYGHPMEFDGRPLYIDTTSDDGFCHKGELRDD